MSGKILVVDDDFITVMAYSEALEARKYVVARAFDGIQALQTYEQFKPDLLITDIKMPRMGGLYLVRKIRSIHLSLPIIIATGSFSKEAGEAVMGEIPGPLLIRHKPISGMEITDLAEAMLSMAAMLPLEMSPSVPRRCG